jgi:hypothetical protein
LSFVKEARAVGQGFITDYAKCSIKLSPFQSAEKLKKRHEVSGHDFSRADKGFKDEGVFNPCGALKGHYFSRAEMLQNQRGFSR